MPKLVSVVDVHQEHDTDTHNHEASQQSPSRSLIRDLGSEDPEVSERGVMTLAKKVMSSQSNVDSFMAGRARGLEQASSKDIIQIEDSHHDAELQQPASIPTSSHSRLDDQDVEARPRRSCDPPQQIHPEDNRPPVVMAEFLGDIKNVVGHALRDVANSMGEMARNLQAAVAQQTQDNHRAQQRNQQRDHYQEVQPPRRNRPRPQEASSDEEADARSEASTHHYAERQFNAKLPPFTGKEKWEVWFTRFAEVARLNNWHERRRLQELLPRLQGPAGDFVYSQLPAEIRSNYRRLVAELNSRFQVVETKKTYAAQFSNRMQKPAETLEDFVADLKRLYSKAYPGRDEQTRKEDLLRKFLDGLYDDRIRFHIEFVKEPDTIDQAIYEAINFQATRRRPSGRDNNSRSNHSTRAVKFYCSSDSEDEPQMVQPDNDEDIDDERIARISPRSGKARKIQRPDQHPVKAKTEKQGSDGSSACDQASFQKLVDELAAMKKLLSSRDADNREMPAQARNLRSNSRDDSGRQYQSDRKCFKCGETGHFARRCPHYKWVQVPSQDGETDTHQVANHEMTQASPPKSGETSTSYQSN